MHNYFDKRLATLEQSSFGDGRNPILVVTDYGDGDAEAAEKVAAAKRQHGIAEDDPRHIIVVRFGAS